MFVLLISYIRWKLGPTNIRIEYLKYSLKNYQFNTHMQWMCNRSTTRTQPRMKHAFHLFFPTQKMIVLIVTFIIWKLGWTSICIEYLKYSLKTINLTHTCNECALEVQPTCKRVWNMPYNNRLSFIFSYTGKLVP